MFTNTEKWSIILPMNSKPIKKSISLGSPNTHGDVRLTAYLKAANGNLSRWLCKLGDKECGLNIPLPTKGRPPKKPNK